MPQGEQQQQQQQHQSQPARPGVVPRLNLSAALPQQAATDPSQADGPTLKNWHSRFNPEAPTPLKIRQVGDEQSETH